MRIFVGGGGGGVGFGVGGVYSSSPKSMGWGETGYHIVDDILKLFFVWRVLHFE